MNKSIVALGVCLLAASLSPAPVQAEQYIQNGSGSCKSALPVFDGNIRNRPTAISNEGSSNAFVSCSMFDEYNNTNTIVAIWIHNNGLAAQDVSCTFVNGTPVEGASFFPKTQAYAPGTGGYILWNVDDNGGNAFNSLVNFSCNLPPGVEVRLVTYQAAGNI